MIWRHLGVPVGDDMTNFWRSCVTCLRSTYPLYTLLANPGPTATVKKGTKLSVKIYVFVGIVVAGCIT